jgi:hypothetical protein
VTTFTDQERQRLAKTGAAMPDGSFPIRNAEDLDHAIRAVGRASNPAAAKQHIMKRARALMLKKQIPLSWM